MTLTFMDAIIAWARAIEKTNFTDFKVIRRRPNMSVIRMAIHQKLLLTEWQCLSPCVQIHRKR